MKILIAYVPVLYRGYVDFFRRHSDAEKLLLFGPATIARFDWLRKDLRCLDPVDAKRAVDSLNLPYKYKTGFLESAPEHVFHLATEIVMPDETECHMLAESQFAGLPVRFESVKLRYDKKKTESVEEILAQEVTDAEMLERMDLLQRLAFQNSPDWWIRVGAMIVKNEEVLLTAWNEHMPSERETIFMGDPRSNYRRGLNFELTLVDHAEKVLIGEAARRGISLEGSDLLVTTFPCPPCAYLVKRAGIKRVFFRNGYAVLDGDAMLREAKIEIFRVK